MFRPGPRNLITDVPGILVGNAEDARAHTGTTVVRPEPAALAAVDVRGGAPGTREISLLDPNCRVDRIDAIVLSGGSAIGLDAASGASRWLAANNRGVEVAGFHIPIVPAAIVFDLVSGGDKNWGEEPPYLRLGREACANAAADFKLGNVGAGLGSRAGKLKGGLGSASAVDDAGGTAVGAVMVVNCVGAVTDSAGHFFAAPFEIDAEFGGRPSPRGGGSPATDLPAEGRIGGHTCIGVVATDVALNKADAQRVAMMAQDGLARAIRPVHTPFDGDTIFVISTGRRPLASVVDLARIGHVAADCVARAIARGVYAADDLGGIRSYRTTWP